MFSIMQNNNLNKLSQHKGFIIVREGKLMEKNFMTVEDATEEWKVFKSYAYQVIRKLNAGDLAI